MYIMIFILFFLHCQTTRKRKNNAESVRNCAKKAQIDILGKTPILRVIMLRYAYYQNVMHYSA